jgi:hypothetical protein
VSRGVRSKVLLQLIDRNLREGANIEIDGLGQFRLDQAGNVVFQASNRIHVFLAYAEEDRPIVRKLYAALQQAGFEPWMDQEKLLPGQNWPRAIERAIDLSHFFLGCFSQRSTVKRGHFQSELRYALDLAARIPNEQIFLLPVRLNECELPRKIARRVHCVDLFPDWEKGIAALVEAMWHQVIDRNKKLKLTT